MTASASGVGKKLVVTRRLAIHSTSANGSARVAASGRQRQAPAVSVGQISRMVASKAGAATRVERSPLPNP